VPELPEVTVYIDALRRRIVGRALERIRVRSASLLRTVEPALSTVEGRRVLGIRRIGKRIVWELEGDLFLVFHLMITGRFHWKARGAGIKAKNVHAAFDFEDATLLLTEMGTKKRASLHVVQGEDALREVDRGGIDPLAASLDDFAAALTRENRTLKRALADPRILSGIGNAHSDEILWLARLSPAKLTRSLAPDEMRALYDAVRASLADWIARLRAEVGDDFPERITAFHPEMAVHGRYGKPCRRCGQPIQRIVFAENEMNYCASCQTEGRLLKDRALSRLLGADWPRNLEELEEMRGV
jgi:formamidopyrimidine-DNA glycosylase